MYVAQKPHIHEGEKSTFRLPHSTQEARQQWYRVHKCWGRNNLTQSSPLSTKEEGNLLKHRNSNNILPTKSSFFFKDFIYSWVWAGGVGKQRKQQNPH